MKWAIIFYAMFMVDGEPVEHISWGLTFPHHEECIEFYAKNTNKLISGIGDFARTNLPKSAILTEVGCAHATADFEGPTEKANVTLRMPLWFGDAT